MIIENEEKSDFLQEMLSKQRLNVPLNKKLYITDLKRILNKIPISIFSSDCCVWQGYITNLNNSKKSAYINFYFRKKKKALHRILFINFKDDLKEDEYIKFTCKHAGYCCSLNCMRKYKYKYINNELCLPCNNNKTQKLEFDFKIVFD